MENGCGESGVGLSMALLEISLVTFQRCEELGNIVHVIGSQFRKRRSNNRVIKVLQLNLQTN